MDVPPGPWRLSGECVVGVVHARSGAVLPMGVSRLPGPSLVIAARYDDSPVGPYVELAVAEPTRAGSRPGMTVTNMVVTTAEARAGGRSNWGFPKEIGNLSWTSEGAERILRWPEREIVLRATPAGPALPLIIPFWVLQRRGDDPVTVPGRLRGLARVAKVQVEVREDDPLSPLAGDHRGAAISSAKLVMAPARAQRDGAERLRSPREAAEPALIWGERGD